MYVFLSSILENIKSLPTLYPIAVRIMQLLEDKNVSASQIARIIEMDQSLTSLILKFANSSFYGFPQEISTIRHAVVIIGLDEIKNLVLCNSLINSLPVRKGLFDRKRFWEHSIYCAILCKILSKPFYYRKSGELYVAGLLHDIGKVVLDMVFHEKFEKVLSIIAEGSLPPLEVERKILGITHPEIGGALATKWNFSPDIIDAITFHHDPLKARHNVDITCIVHLANAICLEVASEEAKTASKLLFKIDQGAWEYLKTKKLDLDETNLEEFYSQLERHKKEAQEFLEIIYK